MPKVIVSIDGVVIKEVQLTKDRTTLGRRPYNDIVIDNLAVSGEHAVIQIIDGEAVLEDLNSTNGTYINGKAVKKQSLQNNDTIEIGKYKIRFQSDQAGAGFDKTMVVKPASSTSAGPSASMPAPLEAAQRDPAKACMAPGPIEVMTAAVSPVRILRAVTACAAAVSWRTFQVLTSPASS